MTTHMRLTTASGHPGRALCDAGTTGPLVTDPADVTCRTCGTATRQIIAEQERYAEQAEAEDPR